MGVESRFKRWVAGEPFLARDVSSVDVLMAEHEARLARGALAALVAWMPNGLFAPDICAPQPRFDRPLSPADRRERPARRELGVAGLGDRDDGEEAGICH